MILIPSRNIASTIHSGKLRIIPRQKWIITPVATVKSDYDEPPTKTVATTTPPPKRPRLRSPSPPTTANKVSSQGPSFLPVAPTRPWDTTETVRNILSFTDDAAIPIFPAVGIPSPDRLPSYNDELRLGSFLPSRYTWAGEQRKGISMHIKDSSPSEGHARKSVESDFSLANEIPLPPEALRSIDIVAYSNPQAVRACWGIQFERVKGVVRGAADLQTIWGNATPASIRSGDGRLRTVAMAFLLKTFDLGGQREVGQTIHLRFPNHGQPIPGRGAPSRHLLHSRPTTSGHLEGLGGTLRRKSKGLWPPPCCGSLE